MSFTVKKNVPVPMSDGTELATDIWLPDVDGPVPALLARTPYGKDEISTYGFFNPNVFTLLAHGYAILIQECRGTFNSEGSFTPFVHEAADGVDAIRWIHRQEWCDGNIGMWGGSYVGIDQWLVAATGLPELKAIAPSVASADFYRSPGYSPGGAMSPYTAVGWATFMSMNEIGRALLRGEGDLADLQALLEQYADLPATTAHTPMADRPLLAKHCPWIVETAMTTPERESWDHLKPIAQASTITTPSLNIGGWYDMFLGDTLNDYVTMRRDGGLAARDGQQLVIGPWGHTEVMGYFRDRHFGVQASPLACDLTGTYLAFYDRWLKGREDALDGTARVRLFVMGIDQWRDEAEWPLPDTTYTPFYLSGDGAANTIDGAGTLTATPPDAADDTTDRYLYDPARPVRSLGGTLMELVGFAGALDQSPLHQRDDVLCFQTDSLTEPLEVTGPISAVLHVSSSAVDTDFTAKLVDVHPDGRAIILCDGIQRMRYRRPGPAELIEPGKIYEISIDLLATANVFLPGHRLLLEISSSNFPRYDRNSNTGGAISDEHLSEMVTATNTLHRGATYPSRVILPIVSRRESVDQAGADAGGCP